MGTAKYLMVSVVGNKFGKDDYVSLDNHHFSGCSFEGCHMVYSGGPAVMENCQLNNCQLNIQGSAAILVQTLTNLGFKVIPPPGFSPQTTLVN
jgi:hypothetical protein